MAPSAADDDLIATSQTPSGAGALTLASTTVDSIARIVIITCAGADAARTFIVTGTDADGKAQSESVAGSNGSITATVKYYLTVTSVTVDAATAGAVKVGTRGTTSAASSITIPTDFYCQVGNNIQVSVTGTISFTVQETYSDLLSSLLDSQSAVWNSISALTTKSANTPGQSSIGVTGIRVLINSYSTGATLTLRLITPAK
jgi:hypothetical protein